MKIAYIGNFRPERSTENALAYGLRQHGCVILQFQQGEIRSPRRWADMMARSGGALDAVLYTRTHDRTALPPAWTACWRQLEARGVKTASFHLDVFIGVSRPGIASLRSDPLFTTQLAFTPDPAIADQIPARHRWLPPAADIRAGDPEGVPIAELAGKICFVGSRYGIPGRHPEYPFRAKLLDWLATTYGERFLWFGPGSDLGAPRGKPLWDIYASDAIFVGDSCFAGARPGYWSDRIPETAAHGGLLIHPEIEGLGGYHPFVVVFPPGDLEGLAARIDALDGFEPERRRNLARISRKFTRLHHTYTARAEEIIAEIRKL